ncbi:MAG: class I SAM-dependent methyltransferase [Acidobacteriaceae bacterium]|nr:class I SAM-dependent methyltransferase [Acidobacteriaceae bacterium]MBV9499301.1 class I SAM-dependent methyltransferase [Acidobacteriaceae bacterium]
MKFGAFQKPSAKETPPGLTRHSSGFDQFCATLRNSENLSILDMSGASQANISFITGFGHRISSDDIIGTMEQCFGEDFFESQQAASTSQRFLEQALTFPDAFFDGVLAWDALQFLTSPVLEDIVAQLLRVIRPGGLILTFFNADDKAKRIPVYNYRVHDSKTLLAVPRGGYQRAQYFNNRSIEKLFEQAASLKFFLTRDHLREVIVRR